MRTSTAARVFLWGLVALVATTAVLFAQEGRVDDRIISPSYWKRMAELGLVPVNPDVTVQPPVYRGSKLNSSNILTTDSPDVLTSDDPNITQSENSSFIDPNNSSIVINSNNSTNWPVTILYGTSDYRSTNSGLNWTGTVDLPGGGLNCGDPAAAIGLNGRYYIGAINNCSSFGTLVAYSTNQGTSWTSVTLVASGTEDKNHLWVDNSPTSPFEGNVYSAWTSFSTNSDIVISRSTNDGVSWSPFQDISIAVAGASHDQGVNIQTGPNGEVYAVWSTYDAFPAPENAIGMAKSTDGGATWPPATRIISNISGIRTEGSSLYPVRCNSFPVMAVDLSNGPRRGWIYIVWTNRGVPGINTGNDRDVYMIRSTNGGTSWSTPSRVNQDPIGQGKRRFFPWITCDPVTGGLAVIFYDNRASGTNLYETWVATSMDGGNTWQDSRVSDVAFTPAPIPGLAGGYMGDYLSIVARGGKVYPVWADNRTGVVLTYTSPFTMISNPGWVSGTITTGGSPLSGVAVDFVEPLLQVPGGSDASGNYFAGADVDTGLGYSTFTLRARKFGYNTYMDTLTLVENDTVTRNIAMTAAPGGTLRVHAFTVNSAGDTSGIRATVHIVFGGTEVITDSTDPGTGLFTTPLPTGTYDVTVDPPSPYGTRDFTGVVINAGATTPIEAHVRSVVEPSPEAMRDTLVVGQVHAQTLVLTNTTSDPVPFRISDDNAALRMRLSKPAAQPRAVPIPPVEGPKGAPDAAHGPAQLEGRGGPDPFGYSWIDSDEPGGPTFSWVDIRSVGTPLTMSDDDNQGPFSLGFNFGFYGNTYNQIRVCSNGFLSFTSTAAPFTNTPIPNPSEPNNAIYPFWDDLFPPAGGTIHYYFDAANTRFIVQWTDILHYPGSGGPYSFEAILYGNGEIITQYLSMGAPDNSATIGIENADGSIGLQVVSDATYMHNNLAIRFFLPNATWISENPTQGTLAPNSSQNITVTFDATGLLVGTTYRANIFVDATHTDLDGRITVPASLRVQPADSAVLLLSSGTVSFPVTPLFATRVDSVTARNGGLTTLTISSITSTNGDFAVSASPAHAQFGEQPGSQSVVFAPPQEEPKGSLGVPGPDQLNGQGGPDAFGYRWIDSDEPAGPTFRWVDISSTGTALDSASAWVPTGTNRRGDEGYVAVALPFTFPYYGALKDTLFIGTNGNVMFQRPTGDIFTNAVFPTPGGNIDNHMGAFWDDLEVRAGARVYYGASGGNFVVQYQGMARFAGNVQNYTFEVILTPSGQWIYQFLSMGSSGGTLTSATIGMENGTGTVGLTVVHNAAYMHNNLAIRFYRSGISLPPGDSVKIYVNYTPTAAGTDTGRAIFLSNSQGTPRLDVILDGEGIGVPHFEARVDSLVKQLEGGATDSTLFYVRNTGTGTGDFAARVIMFPRTSPAGKPAEPIVIPVTLEPVRKITSAPRPAPAGPSGPNAFRSTLAAGNTRKNVRAEGIGDVITSWPAPSGIVLPWGVGWNRDADNILVSDPLGPPIENHYVSYDGNLLQSIATPWAGSWPGDAEYFAGNFYQVNVGGNNGIYKLNLDGSVVGFITDPGGVWSSISQRGVAYDALENVFYVGGWNQNMIYKVKGFGSDNPGQVLLSYSFSGVSGLTFHPTSRKLWVADNASVSQIFEVEPSTGAILQQFPNPGVSGFTGAGLSLHSDGNIWCVNQTEATVYLVESGSPLGGIWLSVSPTQGTINVPDSTLFTARFDATDPDIYNNPGNYFGQFEMSATNSSLADTLRIPVRMFVVPPPGARLTVDRSALDFGVVVVNSSAQRSVLVRNIGASQANVTAITNAHSQYVPSPTSFTLNSLDTQRVTVTFTPTVEGPLDDTLNFVSNDPLAPTVALAGVGLGVPLFATDVDTLDQTLEGGTQDSIAFYVRNEGTTHADFAARAIMYPRTLGPGQSAKPLIIPVKIRPVEAPVSHLSPWEANGISEAAYRATLGRKTLAVAQVEATNTSAERTSVMPLTVIDDFDGSSPWPYAPWVTVNPGGSTTGACAHDGIQGLSDPGWHYRTDVTIGNTDERVSIWAKPGTGRLYMGFGATGAGCWSLVIAPNTSTLIIQQNSGFGFLDLASVPQTYTIGQWYKLEIVFGSSGAVAGNLYGSDGSTLLNTVSTTISGLAPAGVAIRSFSGFCGDTFEGGLPGAPWLSVTPLTGTIAMGDSALMQAHFDATDPEIYNNPGHYYGRIEMTATNSALEDTLRVPAHMFVQPPAGARLTVDVDSLDFGDVEIGVGSTLSVLVRNIGASQLDVTNITMSNTNFSANPTSFSLVSLDTQRVNVTFTAPSPGALHTGTMTFVSNDPAAPDVGLRARSVGVPHISVNPTTFTFNVTANGDTTSQSMMVGNTGTDTLHYEIRETGTSLAVDPAAPSVVRSKEQQMTTPSAKGAPELIHGPSQLNGRGGPDGFGYIWIDSDEPGGPTFSWVDISGVGTPLTLGDDQNVGPFSLGFNFSFYGTTYNSIRVCSNGFLSFTSTNASFTNTAIPTTAEPNNGIYTFWDDLFPPGGGTVHYYSDAANQRFIVQFTDVPHFGSGGPYTFQAILNANGSIMYQYLNMNAPTDDATIGIENAAGTIALQVVFNAAYVHNNLAVLITTDLFPWLSTSRTTGTVAPGDSQSVDVRVHPGFGFPPGNYTGRLVVTGDAPDTGFATVNMNVTLPDTTFVAVTSPNGGEQWVIAQTYNIMWIANQVRKVKLEYSTTGSGGPWIVITDSTPALTPVLPHPKLQVINIGGDDGATNLGTYPWVIPNTPSTNCYVRVTDIDSTSIFDLSNAAFSIITAPPDTGSWRQLTSGTGVTLYSVSMGNDTSVAWAAGAGGAVFRTTNGGNNWTAVQSVGIDVYNIFALDATTAFVASDGPSNARILRTTNGGTSWQVVYQNTGASAFINVVHMFNATDGYAMGDPVSGRWVLLRTGDGGATWDTTGLNLAQTGSEAGWNNSMSWVGSQNGWFGTNNTRVYKTTDGGSTWTFGATPFLNSYSVSFATTSLGMAGGSSGGQTTRSTNGGSGWALAGPAGAGAILGMASLDLSPQRWYAVGSGGVYKTTNHGTAWALNHARTGLNHVTMKRVQVGGRNWVCGYAVGGAGAISKYREDLGAVGIAGQGERPREFALEQNYPNPFNPTTSIKYSLPVDASVTLTIFNVLGQEVMTLVNGEQQQASYYEVVWDGKNAAGAPISSGVYFFRIDATPVSGAAHFTQIRKMLMLK